MCVIFATTAKRKLPNVEERKAAWDRNPDGGGIMWSEGGSLHVSKGHMTFDDMEVALAEVPPDAPVVVHYRIGTAGGNTPENTHPFFIRRGLAMCHNGVLSWPNRPGMSDTACFVEDMLKLIKTEQFWDKTFIIGLGGLIGASNKLVLMDAAGNISIVNAASGTKEKGVWFSNTNHRFRSVARWQTHHDAGPYVYDHATHRYVPVGAADADAAAVDRDARRSLEPKLARPRQEVIGVAGWEWVDGRLERRKHAQIR